MNLDHFMLPGQRPEDWNPSTPLDLLPALRVRYPGCICESVLAVQVVSRYHGAGAGWHFRVIRIRAPEIDVPVMPVTQDGDDNYDFADSPADEYPFEMLSTMLQSDRFLALQETLKIFTPAAAEIMHLVHSGLIRSFDDRLESELDHLRSRNLRQIEFLRQVADCLAGHVAASSDLIERAVSNLKADAAFGLRGAGATESRWSEVGEEAASPSLLYERTFDDVRTAVWEGFSQLPRPSQVALWFVNLSDREFWDTEQIWNYEPEAGHIANWKLRDFDEVIERTARRVMSMAGNDYDRSLSN